MSAQSDATTRLQLVATASDDAATSTRSRRHDDSPKPPGVANPPSFTSLEIATAA
ncbi:MULTISPECIES: hypothetical protein [Pseudofrankia]|uniref:hypothetical protein n=1 Tax=Pseudofrankia TaxID=2994363 RepID=UPI0012FF24FA|nr:MULTISPECIES: hypothetical protein [Pseudofrankia]